MDVRSQSIKIRNLPQGHKRIGCINAKPYLLFGTIGMIGILLLLREKYMILGVLLLLSSLYCFLFIKNERLVEFYDEYCVFYRMNTYRDECFLLFWNEIDDWKIQQGSEYDTLIITLRNQKKVHLKCVSRHKLIRYLKKNVNQKQQETAVISKTI